VTIPVDTATTLSVTATGTPTLSYQWYRGASGDVSTPVGSNGPTFTTPTLTATAAYWVRVSNGCGSADSSTATVTVIQRPVISSFTAVPTSILAGQSTTLSWDVAGATSLSINQGIGDVTGASQRVVSPSTTTGYTLTATNLSGSVTASAEVTVCTFSCDAVVPLRGTAGLAVPFAGAGTVGGGCTVPVTYDWNFGDGSAHGTTSSPTHTYSSPNTYTWTLTVNAGGALCTEGGSITIVNPPVLSLIKKVAPPFRIVATGSNLQNGIQVTINGAPWPNVLWKTPGKIKIQGGAALKSAAPKGVPVTLKFVNPDGGEVTTVWSY
jgi:PKD repeat protein